RAQGKVDEGIRCYRKAIELVPNYAAAYSNLGNALCDQQKPDEAIRHYRKAIELEPRYAKAYLGLGRALRAQGKLDDAIAESRQGVTMQKKRAVAPADLALSQLTLAELLNDRARQLVTGGDPKSRDPKRAIDLAQEAAALAPNDGACRKTLGVAH